MWWVASRWRDSLSVSNVFVAGSGIELIEGFVREVLESRETTLLVWEARAWGLLIMCDRMWLLINFLCSERAICCAFLASKGRSYKE